MDLQTAVAASMLPASRAGLATAFAGLHHTGATGPAFLELLWAAAGRRDPLTSVAAATAMAGARQLLETGERLGIEPLPLFDPRYPALLLCTPDPPPVLWCRGQLEVLTRPAVAVVGSRAATPYALQVAERLGGELSARGILVVSGLARGVDSAAHRGSLGTEGATAAVQGCGLDRVYPPEHDDLAARIARSGILLAELGPGAPPLAEHFPLRNRIISGISLATVVVEASERSGSLITARAALEQGRDVMVVPGSVLSGRNRGSHALLKDGAQIVESAEDILDGLGWSAPGLPAAAPPRLERRRQPEPILDEMEPGQPYALDALSAATGLDGPQVLARLTALELSGAVSSAGGRFVRKEGKP